MENKTNQLEDHPRMVSKWLVINPPIYKPLKKGHLEGLPQPDPWPKKRIMRPLTTLLLQVLGTTIYHLPLTTYQPRTINPHWIHVLPLPTPTLAFVCFERLEKGPCGLLHGSITVWFKGANVQTIDSGILPAVGMAGQATLPYPWPGKKNLKDIRDRLIRPWLRETIFLNKLWMEGALKISMEILVV